MQKMVEYYQNTCRKTNLFSDMSFLCREKCAYILCFGGKIMPQINMIIAGRDEEYVKNLANWFMEHRTHQFRISVFTEKESFENFCRNENETPDIILADEAFLCADLETNNNIIILGESRSEKYIKLKHIEKYQPAPGIASSILTIMSEYGKVSGWNKPGKSEIIVCLSPDQALKTTFALYLAYACKDAVYLNFESFPFYRLLPEKSFANKNLSDILYNIKSSKGNTGIALDSAVYTDYTGLNIIPPIDNPNDIWELTENEMDALINSLKSWGHFKTVIADIELNAGPYTAKWLDAASTVFVPISPFLMHQKQRVNNMINSLSGTESEKVKWIQTMPFDSESFEEPDRICYIPELKALPEDWKPYVRNSPVLDRIRAIVSRDN